MLMVIFVFDLAFQWMMQIASVIIASPNPKIIQYQWLFRS